ncbi:hypothetical protein C8R43DRAFT_948406 [Mycena crocata]|nr:hypothetical protein C8R43DRAFT_948406 [Mycena crocata]
MFGGHSVIPLLQFCFFFPKYLHGSAAYGPGFKKRATAFSVSIQSFSDRLSSACAHNPKLELNQPKTTLDPEPRPGHDSIRILQPQASSVAGGLNFSDPCVTEEIKLTALTEIKALSTSTPTATAQVQYYFCDRPEKDSGSTQQFARSAIFAFKPWSLLPFDRNCIEGKIERFNFSRSLRSVIFQSLEYRTAAGRTMIPIQAKLFKKKEKKFPSAFVLAHCVSGLGQRLNRRAGCQPARLASHLYPQRFARSVIFASTLQVV